MLVLPLLQAYLFLCLKVLASRPNVELVASTTQSAVQVVLDLGFQ